LQTNACPAPSPLPNGAFCTLYLSLGLGGLVGLDKDKVAHNQEGVHLDTSEYVLSTSYKKWGHTFSFTAGYLDYGFKQDIDADATSLNLLDLSTPEHYKQYSGEFRVTSPTDQPIEYLFGVYGQDDRLNSTRVQALAFLTPALASGPFGALVAGGPLAQQLSFRQTEQSYAAFGSATWHITQRLSLTGGLRYSKVDKHLTSIDQFGNQVNPFGPVILLPGTISPLPTAATGLQALPGLLGLGKAGTIDSRASDHALLPSAKLQYKLNPDVMFYASYAKGFLAGGFNGQDISGNPANVPYQPEHVNAYEIGVKSQFFDRKVTLNLDVFRSDYSDLQVQQYQDGGGGSVISVVDNAATSRTQGVELEANWRVTHAFTLGATVTYLHARYGDYKNVGLTSLQTFCHAAANHGNSSCVADFGGNGDPGALQDLSGKPTSYAPTWSGNVNASYRADLGDYQLTPSVSGLFNTKYFPGGPGTDDPQLIQRGYVRLDARISLARTNSGLAVDVIGKNLTNRNIITSITNWPNAAGSFLAGKEEPRNIAVQVRYNF
jgi:iron complex outermembrane receptor protein